MSCEICGHDFCHSRCPNYIEKKAPYYCSICGQGIYEGEEYIKNLDDDYIHFECVQGIRPLLQWLGYDVKTVDDL